MTGIRSMFVKFAAAALLSGGASAVLAAPLVVRSSGPSAKSYPAGRALPENAAVTLKAGDTVTVLVANATRVLRGPGTFTLGGAATRGAGAAGFNPRGRFGAMRAGEIPASPSLWHVDVTQSGKVCLAGADGVTLWRPESADPVTVQIGGPGGVSQSVEWGAGADTLEWPSALPIAADAEYSISWTGNDDPTRLSFARIADLPADPAGLAKVLIDTGCQTQLDLFIDNSPKDGG